jgi:lipopolysaccharide biosynthesis protein
MAWVIKTAFAFLRGLLPFKHDPPWYSGYDRERSIGEIEASLSVLLGDRKPVPGVPALKIAVLCHLYYLDLWEEFRHYLKNIEVPFDLYVNLVEGSASHARLTAFRDEIARSYPAATVLISGNRGLDIGGTLELLNVIVGKGLDYDLFLKIHTKKSTESTTEAIGERWRHELLNSLMGSASIVNGIVALFRLKRDLGMVGPGTWLIRAKDNYNFAVGANEQVIKDICRRFNLDADLSSLEFIGGTMFWTDAGVILGKLRTLDLEKIIGELEPGYFRDAGRETKTHSLERVFGLMVLDAKKEIVTI